MAAPSSVHDDPARSSREPSRHSVRVVGYLPRSVEHGLDCESPLLVVRQLEDGSLSPEHWLCSNHRESKCRPCAARYRRRVRAVAEEGLYRGVPGDHFSFVTVTPPGDSPHCKKAGCKAAPFCRHELCPCTPWDGVDLAEWNANASKAWNRLLVLMERHYGSRPKYFRPVEVQKRGGLHKHPVMRTPYAIDEKSFRRLAIEAGFGHEVRVIPISAKSRALFEYVTKAVAGYVTKAADQREQVPWRQDVIDPLTGEVTEKTDPTFRTWSQSRDWGTSMAEIRRQAQVVAVELKALRSHGDASQRSDQGIRPGGGATVTESPPAPS